jgi:hypothetical protein
VKNYSLKKIIFYIFFIFLVFGYRDTFAFVKAKLDIQAQNDFVVEPGKTEIVLDPGQSVEKYVTITNRIGRSINFKLSAEDLIGTDDKNQPVVLLGNDKGPYSLKDFIVPEIREFTLALGEKITIPVTISIPLAAEPRGYYGALIVTNDPVNNPTGQVQDTESKTRLISRIGSLFLVRVNGEGKQEGSLSDFKLIGPHQSFYEKRPQGFEIAFKNTGNVHLVPYGKITIKNMFRKDVAELPVDAYFALPDSTRYREITWNDGFGFGRYTANLSLYKGYGNEYDSSHISFWILPWKILLVSFVALVILVSFFYYISTRFELRKKR